MTTPPTSTAQGTTNQIVDLLSKLPSNLNQAGKMFIKAIEERDDARSQMADLEKQLALHHELLHHVKKMVPDVADYIRDLRDNTGLVNLIKAQDEGKFVTLEKQLAEAKAENGILTAGFKELLMAYTSTLSLLNTHGIFHQPIAEVIAAREIIEKEASHEN